MYFEQYLDDAGNLQEHQVNDRHMARFHLAWDSWWTRKGMPVEEAWQRTCGAYSNDFVWVNADHPRVGRAISTRNLKSGDTFTPYVELGKATFARRSSVSFASTATSRATSCCASTRAPAPAERRRIRPRISRAA